MTDSPTPAEPGPVDPDVELASAHLDEEAGVDERARLEEPGVRAHVAELARVAEQVREVPPAPAGLLDAHVARAMEAFDPDARVVPMASRRAARPWWERLPLGAVAAALVVVVLVGAIGLASQTNQDDDETAATDSAADTEDSGDAAATAESEMADDGAAGFEDAPALESGPETERPAYDSTEQLAADLRDELTVAGTSGAPDESSSTMQADLDRADGMAGADPCGAVELLGLDPADVVLVRSLVITPDEVTAVVHNAADGRRLVVIDDASCTVVIDREL